jgi:hypothetical protein
MPEIMSGDIQAILKNLHARITALESNNKQHLGTTPDFWPSRLKRLYENLKKYQSTPNNNARVGWQLKEIQDNSYIAGKGYKNEKYYSIEIHIYHNMFRVDCWDFPDGYEQPQCISQMCNYVEDVKEFLDKTFPS